MSALLWMTLGRLFARDRSPARRKLTWKGRLLRLLVMCVAAAALYGVYVIPRTPALKVQTVEVEGLQHLSKEEVVDRSGLVGRGLYAVRSHDVEGRLEAMSYVARATVDIGLSTTVRVRIEERVPRLVWRSEKGTYLVDGTGVVLEKVAHSPRLPLLQSGSAEPLRRGDRLDSRQVAFVLTLFGELPADVRPVIEKLTYDKAVGYQLVSTAGWTAAIGDDTQVGVKTQVLRRVLKRKGVEFVDVSAPTSPYYRTAAARKSGSGRDEHRDN